MSPNRRRYKRFSATAFLNRPVLLKPLPPFFGQELSGRLIDLSAGGMAIIINEMIPLGSKLMLTVTFPDQYKIETAIEIRHVAPRGNKFIVGIEFLTLGAEPIAKIEKLSSDYIDCETRIHQSAEPVCLKSCSFYSMCTKSEKLENTERRKEDVVFDIDARLELVFKVLEQNTVRV